MFFQVPEWLTFRARLCFMNFLFMGKNDAYVDGKGLWLFMIYKKSS